MHESLKRLFGNKNYESLKAFYYRLRHIKTAFSASMRKKGLGCKKYSSLHELKDKYKGERCFIVSINISLSFPLLYKKKVV